MWSIKVYLILLKATVVVLVVIVLVVSLVILVVNVVVVALFVVAYPIILNLLVGSGWVSGVVCKIILVSNFTTIEGEFGF